MSDIQSSYSKFLQERDFASLTRVLTVSTRGNSRLIEREGRKLVNFGGNDYLGLTFHPDILDSMQKSLKMGAGSNASRLVTGNLDILAQTEEKLAEFLGVESTLIMASGYQANSTILPALMDQKILGAEPVVIMDKLVHASIYSGCKAAGIRPIRFHHNDMTHLQQLLEKYAQKDQPVFIITESVFSMDGDRAPIKQIKSLATQYQAFFICDEAHAVGIYGASGAGLAPEADLVIGAFGKAFGVFGSYVSCSRELKRYLVNKCTGVIYSTALPPVILAAISAAIDLMPRLEENRQHLFDLSTLLRKEIQTLGYSTLSSDTHIIPIMMNDAEEALAYQNYCLEDGFFVPAMRPPTVPPHMSRLRVSLSAAHEKEDIYNFVEAFKKRIRKQAA